MNFKKILIAGFAAGMVGNLWALLTCRWLFKWVYFIEPTNLYNKAMLTGEPLWLVSIGTGKMIVAIIIALMYSLIYKSVPYGGIKKGILFGFIIWLSGILPSRFLLYMSINISPAIIIYWLANDLITYILAGAVIGVLYKE